MRLEFAADGTVRVRTGKVELGQGIRTALAQIAADELGLAVELVQVLSADTAFGPDEGVTSGSLSVQDGGSALRAACIEARKQSPRGEPLVGSSLQRTDLAAKFAGAPSFIHDLAPPGLLHGRVLHPLRRDAQLADVDLTRVASLPGVVAVHRDGQLLGVLAERSRDADRAIEVLSAVARWTPGPPGPTESQARAGLTRLPASTSLVAEHGQRPSAGIARTLTARYSKPWIAHASIAPSCALARWEAGRLEVWTHSQGIYNLRRDLALAFGVDADAVRVRHADGAGCYGHNGADDVAFDAAWLARGAPGRTVRVLWSRADELSHAPFGTAMAVELAADLDARGEVLHWRHQVWSAGHSGRPGRNPAPALLGSWQTAQPVAEPPPLNMPLASGGGAERNAVPGYALPARQVLWHRVPATLRSSALRSLGAFANVFAAESFVDEIANAAGCDPLQWRLHHLAHDARALAVLELAAARASWASRVRAEGVGHGLAFARYKGSGAWCAVVAEVEAGAQLTVRRLTIAVDVGQVVNPDGVVAQIEGGAIQATSWALKEAVQFDAAGITSNSWASYPILRFSEVPAVDVHLVASQAPSVGAGEASLGPTVAAIANALFDALGVRVRDLPLSAERIVAAMGDDPH
jgi:nicotinate dehydrogenase subunit B